MNLFNESIRPDPVVLLMKHTIDAGSLVLVLSPREPLNMRFPCECKRGTRE